MISRPEQRALLTSDFSYDLPAELIAQTPAEPRDSSRLLVLAPGDRTFEHAIFRDLPAFLRPGDLLIANRSRVLPARLEGRLQDGRRAELLLLRKRAQATWEAIGYPGKRLRRGATIELTGGVAAQVLDNLDEGVRVIAFEGGEEGERLALANGKPPLPPYIRGWTGNPNRYQTIYADVHGSAAAPTAGLHFTPELLAAVREAAVEIEFATLHIGLDTFRSVKAERASEHPMHAEYYEVPPATARALVAAKRQGRRIIAVGTTVVRTLESVADPLEQAANDFRVNAEDLTGWTRLFILPGYRFRVVDGLITNFHLPRSTLLMLVSAFIGRERALAAYAEAIRQRYRFYSFGDAMLAWRADQPIEG